MDILPRSGPIAISVEYTIEEPALPEFLQAMAQRQLIRRRNGAQQWTLLRDTMAPNVWIEQFEMPTWVDYVRFHTRTTHADAPISDLIRSLHSGSEPPRVRRMLIRDPEQKHVDPVAQEPVDIQ